MWYMMCKYKIKVGRGAQWRRIVGDTVDDRYCTELDL